MKLMFEDLTQEEFLRIASADQLCSFIWDFQSYLRTQVRYRDSSNRDDIHKIYETWFEMMRDAGVNIEIIYR